MNRGKELATFEVMQIEHKTPEALKNVETVIHLVGADLVPGQLRILAGKQNVLVEPAASRFEV